MFLGRSARAAVLSPSVRIPLPPPRTQEGVRMPPTSAAASGSIYIHCSIHREHREGARRTARCLLCAVFRISQGFSGWQGRSGQRGKHTTVSTIATAIATGPGALSYGAGGGHPPNILPASSSASSPSHTFPQNTGLDARSPAELGLRYFVLATCAAHPPHTSSSARRARRPAPPLGPTPRRRPPWPPPGAAGSWACRAPWPGPSRARP